MKTEAEKIKTKYGELTGDKKLMSGIYMITLVTALLILALVIRGPEKSGTLIVDGSGDVTGINRSSLDRSERYDLSLEVSDDGRLIERDVVLTLRPENSGADITAPADEDDREASINAGIDMMINEIEYSQKKKIILPAKLPDGTAVRWRAGSEGGSGVAVFIPAVYLALLALMIASRFKKDGKAEEERRSIMRGLPRFCNQLFLMMNAGLILSDAFDIITGSYASGNVENLSSFERDLAGLRDATDGHRISTAHVINEYALRHDIKEMIRIAAILSENERRGSNVIDSLARESRYLWDERKIVARESGKMIDTKMSYPLGLLLIVLIVITMAPALLNM